MRRRLRYRVASIAGALLLAACEISGLVGPEDFRRLANAEAQWKARPFADYSYEIKISCFCPPEIGQWTRVTVPNGTVVDAVVVAPDPRYPITNVQFWEPIDSLFVDLRRTMSDEGSRTYLEAIIATYDATLGFPTSIEYRAKANVIDGGSLFSVRNVQPQ